MSGVRGSTSTLRKLSKTLRSISAVAAVKIAKKAAPPLTGEFAGDFDAGLTAHGDPRPLGVEGNALSLVQSGDTRRDIKFTSDGGTKIRAVLGTKYAKYLIGKYGILPSGTLPTEWQKLLAKVSEAELDRLMGGV